MKKVVFAFILGLVVAGSIGVVAYNYNAKDIEYVPSDSNWNVNTVGDAIDDLKNSSSVSGNFMVSNMNWNDVNTGFKPKKVLLLVPQSGAGYWINLVYDPDVYGNKILVCSVLGSTGSFSQIDVPTEWFEINDTGFRYKAQAETYYGNTYWYAIK